ncbi:hypothetical protein V8C40DRAFT_266657 [Trichoderma camerunense]
MDDQHPSSQTPDGIQGQPGDIQGQPDDIQGQPDDIQGQSDYFQGQPVYVQCQPRDDAPALDRWLAQQPGEDAVLTVNLRETQGIFTEETLLGWQARNGDISVDSIPHVAGCQVTDKNSPLANRIPPYHHQNNQGHCGQPFSNAHDTIQTENFSAHQHQDHLIRVLLPSPGQETWGQRFDQASVFLGLPGTADYSGTSYGAIQLNNEVYPLSDTPDATFPQGITYDRIRTLQQLFGEVQGLCTFVNASRSLQPFAPGHLEFNPYPYPFPSCSVDGTSVTHTAGNFGLLGTNQPRNCTPTHYPGPIPSHSSTNLSPFELWRYGSTTIPSYSSDTHSRAVDEVFSEMTLITAPITDIDLPRNNSRPYNLDPVHVSHSNPANIGKPTSDSPEAQNHGTEGPAKQATRRATPRQYVETGRVDKNRRGAKISEDEHNLYAYSCPFYLKNPSDYGKENIYFANIYARSFYVRNALKSSKMVTAYGSTLSRSVKEKRILHI